MAKSKSPRKKYTPKPISKDHANKIIYSTIFKASTQSICKAQIDALINPFRAQIEALRTASIDLDGWTRLNEMNLFSFLLAGKLFQATSNEEARKQIAPSQQAFELASESLFQIGNRWRQKGKFGASGDELTAIRESQIWLFELLQIAPEGMALEALMEAEKDIDNYWRKVEQAA